MHGVTLASLRESAEFPAQVREVLAMFARARQQSTGSSSTSSGTAT